MFTRRNLLQAGLWGGANLALPIGCSSSDGDGYLGVAGSADALSLPNPQTTPWMMELPIPPYAQEVACFGSPSPLLLGNGPGTHFYEIVEEERQVCMHPELPLTRIWSYRDATVASWPYALGPTFRATMSHEPGNAKPPYATHGVVVRTHNNLPCTPQAFGYNFTTMHLHGTHTQSAYDGFPTLDFGPGQQYDYAYPMHCPGFISSTPQTYDIPSTMWYHDHALDFTGPNLYKGLLGLFLVFDQLDPGDEANTAGLGLASGRYDIPLVIQDKIFAPDGSLVYNTFGHVGLIGNKFLVNGAIQPYLRVKRRKYRFRVLDASDARGYWVFLSEACGTTFPFCVIATEGGLLARSVNDIESFKIGPAERVEILIDFSKFPAGTELYLENRLAQSTGLGPDFPQPNPPPRTPLLKLMVEDTVPDGSQMPYVLRHFDPIDAKTLASAAQQTFEFDVICPQTDAHCAQTPPIWTINSQVSGDLSVAMASATLEQGQLWTLKNPIQDWMHPVHIHHAFMRVLKRHNLSPAGETLEEVPVPLGEQDGVARRDTIPVGPSGSVTIFIQFRDFRGKYVMHCHNLEHEDMSMMCRFDVK